MKKISSRLTVFYKMVFPWIWFGPMAYFMIIALMYGALPEDRWVAGIMLSILIVLGLLLMKKLAWDLMDEVHDGGDFLVARNRGKEERIPLRDIMDVSVLGYSNPPRVTLRLVRSSRFGREVTFTARLTRLWNPFAKSPLVEDLIVRANSERRQRAA